MEELMLVRNKLECLSLTSYSTLV